MIDPKAAMKDYIHRGLFLLGKVALTLGCVWTIQTTILTYEGRLIPFWQLLVCAVVTIIACRMWMPKGK